MTRITGTALGAAVLISTLSFGTAFAAGGHSAGDAERSETAVQSGMDAACPHGMQMQGMSGRSAEIPEGRFAGIAAMHEVMLRGDMAAAAKAREAFTDEEKAAMQGFMMQMMSGMPGMSGMDGASGMGHGTMGASGEKAEARHADEMDGMSGKNAPDTGSPEADFLIEMIGHHRGAIAMAREITRTGTDAEVKALAESVIEAQDGEVEWMSAWLEKNGFEVPK